MERDELIKQSIEKMEAALGVYSGDVSFARFVELRKQIRAQQAVLGGALGEADVIFAILLRQGMMPGQTDEPMSASQ